MNVEQQSLLRLVIRQIRLEANGIHSYELVSEDGAALPAFTAGSHLDIHLPSGTIRQYSLSNDPAEQHRYVIGVLRDERGRGGSKEVHSALQVGHVVQVSAPRNHFHLNEKSKKIFLLAGGIGITPLKAMAHRLKQLCLPFELHYCARGRDNLAFIDELRQLGDAESIHFHIDGGKPENGLDIASFIAALPPESGLYYCGPSGFMQACAQAAAQRSDIDVHCEHFKVTVKQTVERDIAYNAGNEGEQVFIQIRSTNQTIPLTKFDSIIDTLAKSGVEIPTSCQSGLCGTCKTRYISGQVEHGDYILSDEEHAQYLTPCVSHVQCGTLVLDL
jgi:vanillate O-demethylase ferredoxin subunit